MRIFATKFDSSVALAALLTACAGNSQNASTIFPNSAAPNPAVHNYSADVLSSVREAAETRPLHVRIPRDLYVADNNVGIDILTNKSYQRIAIIKQYGFPCDDFLDANGNLYVPNCQVHDSYVDEYAPRKKTPSFTYDAGLQSGDRMTAVAVDVNGNVFVGTANGEVLMYRQRVNSVAASCTYPGQIAGLAVDSPGDVFTDAFSGSQSKLMLTTYDLTNCAYTQTLPVTLDTNASGIAEDNQFNLVVADGSQVLVIPDPYTSVKRTIGSGFRNASNVHLKRDDSLAFVTDSAAQTVTVVNYYTGADVIVLGTSNGIVSPNAAVDWPNDIVQ